MRKPCLAAAGLVSSWIPFYNSDPCPSAWHHGAVLAGAVLTSRSLPHDQKLSSCSRRLHVMGQCLHGRHLAPCGYNPPTSPDTQLLLL
eukprot:1156246-Pelagomonas_calceolata.AAC.3